MKVFTDSVLLLRTTLKTKAGPEDPRVTTILFGTTVTEPGGGHSG